MPASILARLAIYLIAIMYSCMESAIDNLVANSFLKMSFNFDRDVTFCSVWISTLLDHLATSTSSSFVHLNSLRMYKFVQQNCLPIHHCLNLICGTPKVNQHHKSRQRIQKIANIVGKNWILEIFRQKKNKDEYVRSTYWYRMRRKSHSRRGIFQNWFS